jgi:gamma-butyrobetaine dioxygenase
MLHCIEQSSEGGENEFSDGFHVAEQLRKDDPETFRILSKTLVGFTNIATNVYAFHMKQTIPIIWLVL